MAEIRAFRGIRYAIDRIGDIGDVVAPPYDVIDGSMQRALYDAHPNNIVRIIQGIGNEGDSIDENRYTRAADAYRNWLEQGVLVRDRDDGIYLYAQDFDVSTPDGKQKKTRLGIVALVRADALGKGAILPHENTMPGPKADRLALMRHTRAAFGQIFSLYSDPTGQVREILAPVLDDAPLFTFRGEDGVGHSFWRITDQAVICGVANVLNDMPFFIADGHHRYETAVVYRDECAAADNEDWQGKPYGYRMQTLVNMDDTEGMAINAIHRVVVDLGADGVERLIRGIAELCDVERLPLRNTQWVLQELKRRAGRGAVFGFCHGACSDVHFLKLKRGVRASDLDGGNHSEAWRRLDTGLLQLILGRVLELDQETLAAGEKVKFVKVEREVLDLVKAAPDRAGFFLNPVGMEQLRDVVLAGERMPPKSTFFYPKVYSGLVIQDLRSF
ncbi:MAG: DUF1015 domain-containing protein [Gemmatimonadota bacterium]|nr:DUF1015 domain-containing protein [Gemmatimonadota bacterium]